MRVQLVLYGALASTSGGFLYDRRLVRHLAARGDRVEVVELPWPPWPRGLLASRDARRRVLEAAERFHPQVVVEDELAHPSLLLAHRALRRREVPVVSIVHLLETTARAGAPGEAVARRIEAAYARGLDGVVAVNGTIARRMSELAGRKLPAVVAPPAADHLPLARLDAVEGRALAPGPLRVLFLGGLTRAKGFERLVEALCRVGPRVDWRLRAVGRDDLEPGLVAACRSRLAEAGLADRVEALGPVPPEEVSRHLAACHLLALPSVPESASIAVLEAERAGLPALVCRESDTAALVVPGETGFLTPTTDPRPLAARLEHLARDRPRLATLSRAALARAGARPGWADTMERVREFLAALEGRGALAA